MRILYCEVFSVAAVIALLSNYLSGLENGLKLLPRPAGHTAAAMGPTAELQPINRLYYQRDLPVEDGLESLESS